MDETTSEWQRFPGRQVPELSAAKSPWTVRTIQVNLRESARFRTI